MRTFLIALLTLQVATFAVFGSILIARGQVRLGIAQLMLAAVQAIIYSAGVS